MNLSLGIYIGDLSQFRSEQQQQRLSQRIYLSSDRGDKINQYFSVNTPQHDTRPIGSINKQKWIKRHKKSVNFLHFIPEFNGLYRKPS